MDHAKRKSDIQAGLFRTEPLVNGKEQTESERDMGNFTD